MSFIEAGAELPIICQLPGSTPTEEFAARELQSYLQKITGQSLRLQTGTAPGPRQILLGTRDSFENVFGPEQTNALEEVQHPEGFWMQMDEERLALIGRGPAGVLAAVYQLLEFLGARWFEPGPDGEEIVRLQKVDLGKAHRKMEPLVGRRGLLNVTSPEGIDWMGKNRLNHLVLSLGKFLESPERILAETELRAISLEILSENLTDWLSDSEELFQNPETRALQGDLRAEAVEGTLPLPCPSHPEVQAAVSRGLCEFLKEQPAIKAVTLDLNSALHACECKQCEKLRNIDKREVNRVDLATGQFTNQARSYSGGMWSLFQRIHDEIEKELPDRVLRLLADIDTFHPPENDKQAQRAGSLLRLRGRCFRHMLNSAECFPNQSLWQPLEAWSKHTNASLLVRDSVQGPDDFIGMLFPSTRLVCTEVLVLFDLGIDGLVSEARWDGSTLNGLTLWTYARQAWFGEGSVDSYMDEFFARYYGNAAGAMRAYQREWYFKWLDIRGCFLGRGIDLLRLMGFKQFLQAQEHLEAAARTPKLPSRRKKRLNREISFFHLAGHAWNFMHSLVQKYTYDRSGSDALAKKQQELVDQRRKLLVNFARSLNSTHGAVIEKTAEEWSRLIGNSFK